MGIPKIYPDRGAAMTNSFVYVIALIHSSPLRVHYAGFDCNRHRAQTATLNSVINLHCFDMGRGVYLDGPDAVNERSQHAQDFVVGDEDARD